MSETWYGSKTELFFGIQEHHHPVFRQENNISSSAFLTLSFGFYWVIQSPELQTWCICLRERYLCISCCNLQSKKKSPENECTIHQNTNKLKEARSMKHHVQLPHVNKAIMTYRCFCSNIFSRAFTSTLSHTENTLTQALALSFTENSDGNMVPQRTDSILSDLHNQSTL